VLTRLDVPRAAIDEWLVEVRTMTEPSARTEKSARAETPEPPHAP